MSKKPKKPKPVPSVRAGTNKRTKNQVINRQGSVTVVDKKGKRIV